jgi:metal-sulfur cluster biosynthetic enzyme
MADPTPETIRAALEQVRDPELGFHIVELGLVRDIHVSDDTVQIEMTLTTPACPYGPELLARTERAAAAAAPGREPVIHLVWSPPWDPERDASEDVLAELGRW